MFKGLVKAVAVVGLVVGLSSCVYLDAGPIEQSFVSNKKAVGPKAVAFVPDIKYEGELTNALQKRGFDVRSRPIKLCNGKAESVTCDGRYTYSPRHTIKLTFTPAAIECAFTKHIWYNFELTLTDMQDNRTVTILRQMGPDGPCTTAIPVFETLAEELAKNWE